MSQIESARDFSSRGDASSSLLLFSSFFHPFAALAGRAIESTVPHFAPIKRCRLGGRESQQMGETDAFLKRRDSKAFYNFKLRPLECHTLGLLM